MMHVSHPPPQFSGSQTSSAIASSDLASFSSDRPGSEQLGRPFVLALHKGDSQYFGVSTIISMWGRQLNQSLALKLVWECEDREDKIGSRSKSRIDTGTLLLSNLLAYTT